MVPWSGCTTRAPPIYDLSSTDYAQVCYDGSSTRLPCENPSTGKKDMGLGVRTGNVAPEFALPSIKDSSVMVKLSDLLNEAPYVLVQFGAYT